MIIQKQRIKCPKCATELNFVWYRKHLIKEHCMNEVEVENSYLMNFYPVIWNNMDILCNKYIQGESFSDLTTYVCRIDEEYKIFGVRGILKKFFKLKGIKIRNLKESHNQETYLNKKEATVVSKYGVKNISQNQDIKNKKINTMLKNYGRANNFCDETIREKYRSKQLLVCSSQEFQDKRKKILFDTYGINNISQIPAVKKKISDWQIEYWKNMSLEEKMKRQQMRRGKGYKYSLAEKFIHEVLNELNIVNEPQYLIKRKFVDNFFNFNNLNVVIEFNGDYWHANPLNYKKEDIIKFPGNKFVKAEDIWLKDKERENVLFNCGVDIIFIIWEKDVRIHKKIEKQKIKELIENFLMHTKEYKNVG